MITGNFLHIKGIGPAIQDALRKAGFSTWIDIVQKSESLPVTPARKSRLLQAVQESIQALKANNICYFVQKYSPAEHWRILAEYFHETTFFDIETTGITRGSSISVIVCYHKGQLFTFTKGENLESFLELLDEVTLLASFNGGSFDVPFVLDYFRIPELPCPHIDLRWVCYHAGMRGKQKFIEKQCGITRPCDINGVDGLEAVFLWQQWIDHRNREAKQKLIRYCSADVIALINIIKTILQRNGIQHKELKLPGFFQL